MGQSRQDRQRQRRESQAATEQTITDLGTKYGASSEAEAPVTQASSEAEAPTIRDISGLRDLDGVQLGTAMLTLRLAGHHAVANIFQAEITRRAMMRRGRQS